MALDHREALRSHNSLNDVMTGLLQQTLRKVESGLSNQVGETFGSYKAIMKDEEYEGYNSTRDRGYLLFLEGEAEAKFLTNNNVFQKLMQGSQFFNQEPDEPLGGTLRMDPGYPDKPPPRDKYDQYGFEVRREKPWAALPCFIPFAHVISAASTEERRI